MAGEREVGNLSDLSSGEGRLMGTPMESMSILVGLGEGLRRRLMPPRLGDEAPGFRLGGKGGLPMGFSVFRPSGEGSLADRVGLLRSTQTLIRLAN